MISTTPVTEQQASAQDFICLTENSMETLLASSSKVELELDNVLTNEFEQGLPADLNFGV